MSFGNKLEVYICAAVKYQSDYKALIVLDYLLINNYFLLYVLFRTVILNIRPGTING